LEKAEMAQRPDFSALKKAVGHGEILGEGDKGAAVVDLQRLLSKRGFPTDTDGSFGPNTAASVKKFQAANNIVQNGQVGVTTLKALESAQGGGQSLPGGGSVLNVPFYKQTDNYTMPDRTCNSSACAMAAKYLGANISGDDQYLRRVLQHGDTTDHSAQTRALNDFGIKSSFHYNLDFKDIDKALAQGKPVVIGINHRGPRHAPTGGHMVTVIGKQGNDYIVNDPYGSLNDGYTGAVENGKGVRYSRAELEARWTVDGPNTGWGRIFS
jgi:peptidoglycan hydrolase-like protein with peptidoglycan-binding domain